MRHFKFGKGVVTEKTPSGSDFEVCVDFESCGPKKMFASLAKLKSLTINYAKTWLYAILRTSFKVFEGGGFLMKHEIEVREDGPVEGAKNAIISVAIIVGIIAIIVGIAVAVYKYLTPDYLDDFDEFDDDFDDDFFDDDVEDAEEDAVETAPAE